MKARKFLVVILIFVLLCGCSGSSSSEFYDTGTTSFFSYENYDYWNKDNELRLVTNPTVKEFSKNDDANNEVNNNLPLPDKYENEIKNLKDGIISFFEKGYNLDVSDKISDQEINVFSYSPSTVFDGDIDITMGYMDINNPNVLNLNSALFTEGYSHLFRNTYIHETLHQMGLNNVKDGMLTEGIADAFTDLILCYMGKESFTTEFYFDSRTLAYQIIAVDRELPELYFTDKNFSLADRISERLKSIPQPYEKTKKVGDKLVTLTNILYSDQLGAMFSSTDSFFCAYDAQEIVRAYCQTFSPIEEQINYIRSHYLIEDFEEIDMQPSDNGEGYYF